MPSTPCINVCEVDDGKCTACGRTIEDIMNWKDMSEEQRRERMKELQQDETS